MARRCCGVDRDAFLLACGVGAALAWLGGAAPGSAGKLVFSSRALVAASAASSSASPSPAEAHRGRSSATAASASHAAAARVQARRRAMAAPRRGGDAGLARAQQGAAAQGDTTAHEGRREELVS